MTGEVRDSPFETDVDHFDNNDEVGNYHFELLPHVTQVVDEERGKEEDCGNVCGNDIVPLVA